MEFSHLDQMRGDQPFVALSREQQMYPKNTKLALGGHDKRLILNQLV